MSRRALFLSLFLAGSALAQVDAGLVTPPLQLSVRATPDQVKLGEPFAVELTITHLASQRYELKTPSDLGDFDYLGQTRKRVDGADSSTTIITVSLAAFTLGPQRTPGLTLEVTDPEGVSELTASGTGVEVLSALPPDAQKTGASLYDVRPPEEIPVRTWRVLYALAGLLGAGLLAWLVFRWWNRPKAVGAAALPPPEPVDVRALKALDALREQNLPAQAQFKPYYFRLSEIVRAYLGELYGFEALESTTPELLALVRRKQPAGLAVDDLSDFAHQSDFIRYAKTEPTVDECRRHLELAYRIVHETTAAVRALTPPTPGSTSGSR